MRRLILALTAFTASSLPIAAAFAATVAPVKEAFAPPSEAERLETIQEFVEDAMRTVSDRSGDIFFLPRKYNFVTGIGPDKVNTGHVKVDGQMRKITSTGIPMACRGTTIATCRSSSGGPVSSSPARSSARAPANKTSRPPSLS